MQMADFIERQGFEPLFQSFPLWLQAVPSFGAEVFPLGAAFSEKILYKVSGTCLLVVHKATKRCPFSVSLTINTKPEAALAIRFAFFQIQNKTPRFISITWAVVYNYIAEA